MKTGQLLNGNRGERMKSIVTVDTGTTNTRAVLWQNGEEVANTSESVGVRDTSITGNNKRLKNAVKKRLNQS